MKILSSKFIKITTPFLSILNNTLISEKLNKIVNSQIEKSTAFWAGKPKLTKKELSAVASFAKKKNEV